MTAKIPLQNGEYAIVDKEDYEEVNRYNWFLLKNGKIYSKKVGLTLCAYIVKRKKGEFVTHKNKDYLDNRKQNLLITTSKKVIVRNQRGQSNTTSRYKGVSWNKAHKKWEVRIYVNGKNLSLGNFKKKDEDLAALAYNEAARKHFGENAYQNIIGENNNATEVNPTRTSPQYRTSTKQGYKGVEKTHRSKYPYRTNLWNTHKGEWEPISYHETLEQAARAYDKKAYRLYGDKAILNYPESIDEYEKEIKQC